MPFTPSHAAAVLPFVGRAGLAPAALVIGSMAPDLPYFLQLGSDSTLTHSARGLVSVDLLMGLVVFALWQGVVGPAAYAVAPVAVRERTGAPRHASTFAAPRALALVALSLVLGSATHVVWDSFTHPGRWGTNSIAWLTAQHGPFPGYQWAQYGSGVAGLAIVSLYLTAQWRRAPRSTARGTTRSSRRTAVAFWIVAAGATGLGTALGLVSSLAGDEGWQRASFRAATWGGGAAILVVLVGSALIASQLHAPREPDC